jgi:predicted homoserine dehydrogenase-like protein
MYLPYHFMGVETPISLLNAVLHRRASGSGQPTACSVLAGRAIDRIAAGTVLKMGGHHHDVNGVRPVLLAPDNVPRTIAPLYLAANARATVDIHPGELILLEDIVDYDVSLRDAWLGGLN